ncbi:MAG: hypothetical protein JWM85_3210 [Acidimicrobiaceae bacterium]|nr:hypothetical protein [Acidimicrobiaceae bacterium]
MTAIGGGHGLARSLGAARRFAGELAAVVSVADDGGSSGRLRDELGIPAPGDVRRAIGAMLVEPDRLGPLLEYRFSGGDLDGHAYGNLLLAALAATTGDFAAAVAEACSLLGTLGPVFPATTEAVVLRGEAGSLAVCGQVAVMGTAGLERVAIEPADARTPPGALDAVERADLVVLGPGSLFTSVLAALAAPELAAAVGECKGKVAYVCNLHEQRPETEGYDVATHLSVLAAHGVRPDVVVVDRATISLGDVPPGVELAFGDLCGPSGRAHDERRLAVLLAGLAKRPS